MKKRLSGVLGLVMALSIGFATFAGAEEDFKRFGVRFRAIYVMPTEDVDSRLNGAVSLKDSIIPEVDLEYFFIKNISAELIAAVSKHDVMLNGQHFGSTYLLPPTLTAKYHPLAGNTISPYVGVGLNVTFPFDSKSDANTDLRVDNSVGWAAQAGVDVRLKDTLYFNIDYKYINADTKVSVAGTKYDLDINPHLFGIGVGYRF